MKKTIFFLAICLVATFVISTTMTSCREVPTMGYAHNSVLTAEVTGFGIEKQAFPVLLGNEIVYARVSSLAKATELANMVNTAHEHGKHVLCEVKIIDSRALSLYDATYEIIRFKESDADLCGNVTPESKDTVVVTKPAPKVTPAPKPVMAPVATTTSPNPTSAHIPVFKMKVAVDGDISFTADGAIVAQSFTASTIDAQGYVNEGNFGGDK